MKRISQLLLGGVMLNGALVQDSHAIAYQIFPTLAYTNAATQTLVEKFKVMIGGTTYFNYTSYTGRYTPGGGAVNRYGQDSSAMRHFLPYMQIVGRLNSKWTVGFDISNPYYAKYRFKDDILQGSNFILLNKNYSPKVSYDVNDKLAIGGGIDINHLVATFDLSDTLGFGNRYGQLHNKASGTAVGWNLGFLFKALQGTIVRGSYHSQIKHRHAGLSTHNRIALGGPLAAPAQERRNKATVWLPDTINLSLTQFLNKDWFFDFTARWTRWSLVDNVTIENSALPFQVPAFQAAGVRDPYYVPVKMHDNMAFRLATEFKIVEQWSGLLGAEFSTNPQPIAYKLAPLPIDDAIQVGIGVKYRPMKQIEIQVLYGTGWSKPDFNNATNSGKMKIRGHAIDVGLTYKF